MRLRQLEHLVALAEQGSFGRAAQASHLSQPAFSRSIDSLEDALQAPLVDRAYGTVRFTEAGERVLAHARALLADAQRMRHEVLQLQGLAIGSLRVGLGPFAAGMLGRAALSALVRRHPQLAVRLEVADAATLCERLQRRQLDLFIADTRDLRKPPGLKVAPLPRVPVAFFVKTGHPLRRRRALTLAQLAGFPVAGPSLPLGVADYFERLAVPGERGLFSVVCDDPGTLRHLALEADAAILAPDAPAFRHETHPLVPLRIAGLEKMQTHYGIVTPTGHTPSAAAAAYIRCLNEAMARSPARR